MDSQWKWFKTAESCYLANIVGTEEYNFVRLFRGQTCSFDPNEVWVNNGALKFIGKLKVHLLTHLFPPNLQNIISSKP